MRITRTIVFREVTLLRIALISLFFLLTQLTPGQVYDNFADGNFNADPTWLGDTSDFSISYSSAVPPGLKPALKLDGSGSDTSFLTVPSTMVSETEWRFWIKLSFNTSANNYSRVYLVSDQEDLSGPLNGYFVQAGGVNDSIGLFRQSGFSIDQLIYGSNGFTGNSTNILRIKVSRDEGGTWQLYTDQSGGYNFSMEGSCFDATHTGSDYFGLFCRYTSSNATKFYFDDIHVDGIYTDTIPPFVEELIVSSSNKLQLLFSEQVEEGSAEDTTGYTVNGGLGHPLVAERDPADFSRVLLSFGPSFDADFLYTLQVQGVHDLAGNMNLPQNIDFEHSVPSPIRPFDLVINEVMADINPGPAGLPEADYLELYNRSSQTIDLAGFTLKPRASSNPIAFPEVLIPADSFLIVSSTTAAEEFEAYGQVVGLAGFAVNNEGVIVLRDPEGQLIHVLEYEKSWYRDDDKAEGGWSLEQIDPGNPCSLEKTWVASVASEGGTPGAINAVDDLVQSDPEILTVSVRDEPYSLRLIFSHQMDSLSITSLESYFVEGIGSPFSCEIDEPVFNGISLNFETVFQEHMTYELNLIDTLNDCSGRQIPAGTSRLFMRPGQAGPYDVVINEIMADPDPPVGLPGHEYLELFNVTDAYLQMKDWVLEAGNSTYTLPEIIIQPNEYILFVGSETGLILSIFARTFVIPGMVFTNAGGLLLLKNAEGSIVSAVEYSRQWFEDPILSEGGYSLEQVDPYNPCGEAENWKQTRAVEGGSPGVLNSVDAVNDPALLIRSIMVLEEYQLLVAFNQKMSKYSVLDEGSYLVNGGMGIPVAVEPADSLYNRVVLTFDKVFSPGIAYEFSCTQSVVNCSGNSLILSEAFTFGVAEPPQQNDVVINEVLFNPAGDGKDFIEIYNRSNRVINLNTLQVGAIKQDVFGDIDTSYRQVIVEDRLLMMGAYAVLTTDPVIVQNQYASGPVEQFIRMESFPTYNNEAGTVLLTEGTGELIDVMEYNEAMHHPLLTTHEGVSLERINYHRPSGDKTNWHSASSASGYATPGLKNSHYSDDNQAGYELVIEPEIFSPDNDGYEDITNIRYLFPSPGYMASITIFNSSGRPVRYLVNNEMVGTEGSYTWDGITEGQQKARAGIYIVYFEAFNQNGQVTRNKKTVVVGGRRK